MLASSSSAYARSHFYFTSRTERPTRRFLDKDITCGPADKSGAERLNFDKSPPGFDAGAAPRRACLKQTTAEAINLRASM